MFSCDHGCKGKADGWRLRVCSQPHPCLVNPTLTALCAAAFVCPLCCAPTQEAQHAQHATLKAAVAAAAVPKAIQQQQQPAPGSSLHAEQLLSVLASDAPAATGASSSSNAARQSLQRMAQVPLAAVVGAGLVALAVVGAAVAVFSRRGGSSSHCSDCFTEDELLPPPQPAPMAYERHRSSNSIHDPLLPPPTALSGAGFLPSPPMSRSPSQMSLVDQH